MAKERHVVILPFAMQGHLIPALTLAHRLDSLGFQVSYVCPESRIRHVQSQAHARRCHSGRIRFISLKRSGVSQSEIGGHDSFEIAYGMFGNMPADEAEFREILLSLMASSSPPDCIIGDNMVSWAQEAADELKLPRLVIYPSPAQALAVVFHLKALLRDGKYPIRIDGDPLRIPSVPTPMLPVDVSTPALATSSKLQQDFYIRNALRMHRAAGILCNTLPELEPEYCDALSTNRELNPNEVPFLAIGPLLSQQDFPDDKEHQGTILSDTDEMVLLWLNRQPVSSVLYISFGSFARGSREQVQKLGTGLELSGCRFLWVLPGGGEADLPDGFGARTGSSGLLVTNWVNQLMVLSHPATGGFLTHCGWNSTMESITQGVPMLALPFFGEQRANGRAIVERLGIGAWLSEDGKFEAGDVQKGVAQVLGEQASEMRKKVKDLRALASKRSKDDDRRMVEFIDGCIAAYKCSYE